LLNDSNRYCHGLDYYFQKEKIRTVYLISIISPKDLSIVDKKLFTSFHVTLIDKREGAIDKGSNLYLYKINAL
jgi:hypothetical protein